MEYRGVKDPGGLTRERRRGALYDNHEAFNGSLASRA
jgi:hypothetical protein